MAFPSAASVLTVRSRVYDMTGQTTNIYSPSSGTDLGKLSDLIMVEFERDVKVYTGIASGSSPKHASIDGSGVVLEFGLAEYGPATMKLLTQQIRPVYAAAEATFNYQGAAADAYKLGRLLTMNECMSLLIADEENPANNPALFIPYAVVTRVANMSLSMAEKMMHPATFEIIGLHSARLGGPFAFGDKAKFPSWSAITNVGD